MMRLDGTSALAPSVVTAITEFVTTNSDCLESAELNSKDILLRRTIANTGKFLDAGPKGYKLHINGSASESTRQLIETTARAYATNVGKLPHIVIDRSAGIAAVDCCRRLARDGLILVTTLTKSCVSSLQEALRPNTCLAVLAGADFTTGEILNLSSLCAAAHREQVPCFCDLTDITASTGIFSPVLVAALDAFTISFFRMRGPSGIGILGVRNDLEIGYALGFPLPTDLKSNIYIAGALEAWRLLPETVVQVNKWQSLRSAAISAISKKFKCLSLAKYIQRERAEKCTLVWLGGTSSLSDTLSFAAVSPFRALSAQSALKIHGVVIGTGSTISLPSELMLGVVHLHFTHCTSRESLTYALKLLCSELPLR
jgi:hypothetical protein